MLTVYRPTSLENEISNTACDPEDLTDRHLDQNFEFFVWNHLFGHPHPPIIDLLIFETACDRSLSIPHATGAGTSTKMAYVDFSRKCVWNLPNPWSMGFHLNPFLHNEIFCNDHTSQLPGTGKLKRYGLSLTDSWIAVRGIRNRTEGGT